MSGSTGLTVSQVARISGISVRALHHYDEIGLLRPAQRSPAGYRLYSGADLERLQQVLFFRALEVPLDEIARIMGDPRFDVAATLRSQREILISKVAHAGALIRAIEAAIDRLEKGQTIMSDGNDAGNELSSMFEGFKPEEYEAEAEQRWGQTDAFQESKRRTARYTKADWQRYKAEAEANGKRFAAAMEAGLPPDSDQAMDAAEEHRLIIDRWFYPCSREFHPRLGELYVTDPRFTANIDKVKPGMAAYQRDAFAANARRR
jgi:DNA-binding transcriptional MerR regulator